MGAKNLFVYTVLQIALSVVGKVQYPPAEFCNPDTLEGCQGRQAEFAEVWRSQPLSKQLQMLESLQSEIRYEDEADWIDDQMIILENVIEYTKATRGEL
mmetsp:Transcript_28209/g.51018  ORF Transcript_28209/g.51018 Transcript_28209/m.51018 type:complete len:99 (-) Transcript_28209:270-566(-)|eukprot:CAMPEP_0201892050 /NCGR_PEP_ID=MMETSP0902-20130614/35693_1 /ASSEMBLY_ACC=CAM_ASM_000551 /TAXON_ID=420261 /ORGANISM="Thalassiosira antarctica, Strain CCMP982" /LENGTH=98 /DNA_ID=CAMNT_0048423409 /DNA_START=31 /DNA_END=330 /DNA_ORIENTATION=+